MDYLKNAKKFTQDNKLKFHLDGARIFNAAVKHGVKADKISSLFDSVSVCFSKGLGAPVGSALCGSKDQINEARRWRKMLGGGMRQAGMLAGACIYALENNIDRLAQDHDNAQFFAKGLSELDQLNVLCDSAQTNMVFVKLKKEHPDLENFMKDKGILISEGQELRLVTHLDISRDNIKTAIDAFKSYFAK
jgi:threonine aldolase